LAHALDSFQEGSTVATKREWRISLLRLKKLLSRPHYRNDNLVWDWFAEHVPDFLKPVPARRRESFLQGVYEAWDNEECKFWVDMAEMESEGTGGGITGSGGS